MAWLRIILIQLEDYFKLSFLNLEYFLLRSLSKMRHFFSGMILFMEHAFRSLGFI